MPAPWRRSNGFTLIEMLVALLIIGVSIAGLVTLWYFSWHVTNSNDSAGAGTNIARRTVERIKQGGFAGMKVVLNNGVVSPGAADAGFVVTGGAQNKPYRTCIPYTTGTPFAADLFYDASGGAETNSSGSTAAHSYRASAQLICDRWSTDAVATVAPDALITVVVWVTDLRTNREVCRTGTYLVRAGI